jgi:hypothetical protein
VTDIANSYVNVPLGLVCLALQLLASLKCAEVGSADEKKKALDGGRLGELQNEVLMKIFRLKSKKGTGNWRKFHNDLHDFYSPPYQGGSDGCGVVARLRENRSAYRIFLKNLKE